MRSPFLTRLEALAQDRPGSRTVVEDDHGARTFSALYEGALRTRGALCPRNTSLAGRRVAILLSPCAAWVEAFTGVILAGGVAVPLSPLYPAGELAWFAADADADTVIVGEEYDDRAGPMVEGRRLLRPRDLQHAEPASPAPVEADDTALLLYTSGTTGKPKGAMITHENVFVQASLLHAAWGYSVDDTLLHALPLHHLHGLGISLLTSLLAGARARMLPKFEARRVWEELARGGVSVWMAVPTMYQKLIEAFDAADAATQARWAAGARALRLATSGSAALPVTLAARWKEIAGAVPLERFGMTEIGVGMSNPLVVDGRRPGSVGPALPTVEARIVDEGGRDLDAGSGELLIRGPSVFKGYFRREEATRGAFAEGGWFKTGDVAERAADGYVRLLGRTSVDILKSGGYKLSALEIEEVLRENEAIAEVAVVGVPDETWGDRVVAVVVPAPGRAAACEPDALRAWAKEKLPPYKVPREVIVRSALPRNALGKVVKPELVKTIGRETT
ncbi:O-succinylbenzoic acid--CoA ligase [Minicystis rosea]|nr:O-succinylbenzoic acid--CoA ligase [Minicystis rosea]